jgi:hypothetical protein
MYIVEELRGVRPSPLRKGKLDVHVKWQGYPVDENSWEPAEQLFTGPGDPWAQVSRQARANRRRGCREHPRSRGGGGHGPQSNGPVGPISLNDAQSPRFS